MAYESHNRCDNKQLWGIISRQRKTVTLQFEQIKDRWIGKSTADLNNWTIVSVNDSTLDMIEMILKFHNQTNAVWFHFKTTTRTATNRFILYFQSRSTTTVATNLKRSHFMLFSIDRLLPNCIIGSAPDHYPASLWRHYWKLLKFQTFRSNALICSRQRSQQQYLRKVQVRRSLNRRLFMAKKSTEPVAARFPTALTHCYITTNDLHRWRFTRKDNWSSHFSLNIVSPVVVPQWYSYN